ncbi:DegT/DnrJ/EryC1/StrS family aminotransferase [Halorhodospira halochloris]|uniref:DegT/DnrJ/EryC1/StrS family aminotransferase n=1 Tax=Halorhodospira halochloris TaxID=1052 RepID=UPI001EE82C6B|nr:DegT/DnrJ/EryC1/StrS family aminotransferase [Halorhodospira halochloris]
MQIPAYNPRPQYELLREQIESAATELLASGAYVLGPTVEKFERSVAEHLGCRHAIGVNSGTDALFIALLAAGIGRGDEVVTSPFTFFATAEAISLTGATPRFADIDPATFNVTAKTLEAACTDKTKALLPVHIFGQGADMAEINALAEQRGLRVIEDVAQAFGAYQGEKRLGSLGDAGAHSFYPTKNLGGFGDGGMITTNNDDIAEQCRLLRLHGSSKRDHHDMIGLNSRLDAMQAALLQVKLPQVDNWNNERKQIAATYNEHLADVEEITCPKVSEHGDHVYHQYTVRIANGKRDSVQKALAEQGIGSMVYYSVPVHKQPVYSALKYQCPVAEQVCAEVLSLPMWPGMGQENASRVAETVRASVS